MEELVELMKKALADTFAMYLKAHNFHWNVEGADFVQFHEFFGNLYEELHGAVDPIAEHIRAIGAYAPGTLSRFSELTSIEDDHTIPAAVEMANRLLADNLKVIASLTTAYEQANEINEIGLANYLQDRVDIHKKHGWMLRAIIKR